MSQYLDYSFIAVGKFGVQVSFAFTAVVIITCALLFTRMVRLLHNVSLGDEDTDSLSVYMSILEFITVALFGALIVYRIFFPTSVGGDNPFKGYTQRFDVAIFFGTLAGVFLLEFILKIIRKIYLRKIKGGLKKIDRVRNAIITVFLVLKVALGVVFVIALLVGWFYYIWMGWFFLINIFFVVKTDSWVMLPLSAVSLITSIVSLVMIVAYNSPAAKSRRQERAVREKAV